MLDENDPWLLEAELPVEEPSDVLRTMPEMRQWMEPDVDDEELGLRSLLERPEVLSRAWRRSAHAARTA